MAKNTTLSSTTHERLMHEALKEARLAFNEEEVPVGAVVEHKGEIFAKGHNRRIGKNSSIAHAEMEAIEEASRKLGDWRLEGMTLYVTSEPCIMCAGAIIHSRIKAVVYGCRELKMGAAGSICNVFDIDKLHHKPEVLGGVLENECSAVLTEFFEKLRNKK